jgi:hypothetical protein
VKRVFSRISAVSVIASLALVPMAPTAQAAPAAAGCPSTGHVCLYKDANFKKFLRSFPTGMIRRFPEGSSLYHSISSIRNRTRCPALFFSDVRSGHYTVGSGYTVSNLRTDNWNDVISRYEPDCP